MLLARQREGTAAESPRVSRYWSPRSRPQEMAGRMLALKALSAAICRIQVVTRILFALSLLRAIFKSMQTILEIAGEIQDERAK